MSPAGTASRTLNNDGDSPARSVPGRRIPRANKRRDPPARQGNPPSSASKKQAAAPSSAHSDAHSVATHSVDAHAVDAPSASSRPTPSHSTAARGHRGKGPVRAKAGRGGSKAGKARRMQALAGAQTVRVSSSVASIAAAGALGTSNQDLPLTAAATSCEGSGGDASAREEVASNPSTSNENSRAHSDGQGPDQRPDEVAAPPNEANSESTVDATRPWSINEMATFWNVGYATLRGFMDQDEVKLLLIEIMSMRESKWLRDIRNPARRVAEIEIQHIAPAAFRLVFERFVTLASNVHKSWSVSERIAVVQSLSKARGEHLHRDFQSAETADAAIKHEWVQASLLLVLEPETKLIIVPEAFTGAVLSAKCTALEDLSPGDVVVYRGDLPHADAPYKDGNIRIQGIINVDGVHHDEGVVERVAWAVYRCHHCFRNCVDKRDMANHERFCSANPAKAAIAANRKRNNDKGAYCAVCDCHFGKKNTFYTHTCTEGIGGGEQEEKEE